ncbi:hypothetical protein GYMLUDRAFT_164808, partial [Collybiopsis luxurians FD-317 M1]
AVRQLIGARRDLLYDEFTAPECIDLQYAYISPSGAHYNAGSSSSQHSSKPKDISKEICQNYNNGKCSGCERHHVCRTCRQPGHIRDKCQSKRGEGSKQGKWSD